MNEAIGVDRHEANAVAVTIIIRVGNTPERLGNADRFLAELAELADEHHVIVDARRVEGTREIGDERLLGRHALAPPRLRRSAPHLAVDAGEGEG